MQKTFDLLVFIGRFQPVHNGHLAVVREALSQSSRLVMLCGSARKPRTTRDPWTVDEIEKMVRASVSPEEASRIDVIPVVDELYNEERWVCSVQSEVRKIASEHFDDSQIRIGLIGLNADGENYYPKRFPQWKAIGYGDDNGLRSTAIREALFGIEGEISGSAYLDTSEAKTALPEAVRQQLRDYCNGPAYVEIKDEADFIAKYRSAWADAPYPPTFVTVDAVVVQSGHILLVERKAQPGKGLWALPGGFLRGNETLKEACIRELREETRLKVPAPVLKGSIQCSQVFDSPYRSLRGRTITHAYYFELEPSEQLPKVRGSDDARYAFWLPLAELKPENLFEDHYFIIQAMLG